MVSSSLNTLAVFSQGNGHGSLTERFRDLPVSDFMHLLEQITQEFEHFLRAIELINNEALETLLEQLLEAFTLKIGQVLKADRTTIFLVDAEKQQLWSKVAQSDGEPLEIRLPINVGIAGHVAATGRTLNIPDAYGHPMFNPSVDKQTGYHTRNILCMPVLNRSDQVVAVVQLINKEGQHPFDNEDERRFQQFASSIGIILESCNSFYIAARNQRGVEALLKATSSLSQQGLDLEKTLKVVMDEARDLMQADRSTLFLLDLEQEELWSKVAAADGKTLIEIRIPMKRGIAGYVASTGEILNIPNAYEDPRFDSTVDERTGYRTRTILCMPVFNSESTLIGVTQLINKHKGIFTSSDEEFMRAFNIQAGIALENAQLFESVLLEKQYQKDILESLSDAVISTDMQGRIVTINDAALALLGCPLEHEQTAQYQSIWTQQLIGRCVWDVVPIENLRMRVEDSLKSGAHHYVPEQSLTIGLFNQSQADGSTLPVLAIGDRTHPNQFSLWNKISEIGDQNSSSDDALIDGDRIQELERSLNLTVNPLTNPEGGVRGALVVLEDISQEKRMKATMYRYMTPGVAEKVLALGENALMEGERKEVSILFSDIRGYTSLTEQLEAPEVVSLLNNYFETMVEAVFNFEGTLDKFIGDALMAVFGAPLPLENHAWMAVQSALDMRRRLDEFNHNRRSTAQPEIHIGIGISSGEVVSGNIGSQKRMDYTVIGDGVDISSRLEGVTKLYGDPQQSCNIILSEFTYRYCKDRIWVRELDRIRVKGKLQPISIYELLSDRHHDLDEHTQVFLQCYANGRAAYNHRHFQQAMQHFTEAQQIKPSDRAVAVQLERSEAYLQHPPPADWDGVYTMTTK